MRWGEVRYEGVEWISEIDKSVGVLILGEVVVARGGK